MTSFLQNDADFTIENNVLKGKVVSYQDVDRSFGEFVFGRLEVNPDAAGQVDAVTGEEYTFGKIKERSVRCALWMRSQGLAPRDIVVLCSNNQMDTAMPCFGAWYLGAIFNPWDSSMNAEYFRYQMNITKPKMVFASEAAAPIVAQAAKLAKLQDLKTVVFGRVPGFLSFEDVVAEPGVDEVEKFACARIDSSEEIALIMSSSGTTGLSKCVALSHRSLNAQIHQSKAFGMAGRVCLNFASASWMNGMFNILWSLALDIRRIIAPPFEEHSACALIEKYKVSFLFLSPPMVNRLLLSGAMRNHDLSSLARVIYSGTWLSIPSYRAFSELLPHAEVLSGYGLTELGGYLSLQSAKFQLGSTGQILENAELKVVDVDSGRTLGVKQKGELFVRGPTAMSFYYNNPQDTANTLDAEGWVHTGDLGFYDDDGEIFVIDRLKDIIRLSDYDIPPSVIERPILSLPGVKEVVVVGPSHPQDLDLLIAFVVREENAPEAYGQLTEADIVDIVTNELPSTERLHVGVRFIDHLPKTSTDKIQRMALRDLAKSDVVAVL